MKIFALRNLLASPALGALGLFVLFALCFAGVHFVLLLQRSLNPPKEIKREESKPSPPKEEKKQPEEIYYIVERKKRRTKHDYSDPKRIDFK